jgi:hypothetical protein
MHKIEEWVKYQEHLATDHIHDNTNNHIRMVHVNDLDFLNNDMKKILTNHKYKEIVWITLELFNKLKNKPNIKIVENPDNIYYGTMLEEIIRFNVTCLLDIN